MRLAELRIFLFDLGQAIFPSRPQFKCAAVSSGGQGWPPLGGHPKGLSLTAASTVAGFVTRGEKAIITAWDFLLPLPMSPPAFGKRKPEGHQKPCFRPHQKA